VNAAEATALLKEAFAAAVAAAQPTNCLPRCLPRPPRGRTIVVGAGKAAAAMARVLDENWSGALAGAVVTAVGHKLSCPRIEVLQASHPVPDAAGLRAAARMLELVAGLTPDDLVICLLSGGGSALAPLPVPGLTLDEKRRITRDLLLCGATIGEINCVRRHLSQIKGGRLAAACHPARVVTLAISDVPGDDPRDIASGPTVADPTTCTEALEILDRHGASRRSRGTGGGPLRVCQGGRPAAGQGAVPVDRDAPAIACGRRARRGAGRYRSACALGPRGRRSARGGPRVGTARAARCRGGPAV
jgi:hydroxypyruvate reductase